MEQKHTSSKEIFFYQFLETINVLECNLPNTFMVTARKMTEGNMIMNCDHNPVQTHARQSNKYLYLSKIITK